MRLNDAALNLSLLVAKLEDSAEDLDRLLINEFQDAMVNVTESLERRKAFLREVESKIELAKSCKENYAAQQKKYEGIRDRLIEYTKRLVEENPNIPFKDSLGNSLKIVPNAVPKLIVDIPAGQDPMDCIWYLQDPTNEFFIKREVVEIDKANLIKEMKEGYTVEWARLEYGTHLRGLR